MIKTTYIENIKIEILNKLDNISNLDLLNDILFDMVERSIIESYYIHKTITENEIIIRYIDIISPKNNIYKIVL